MDFNERKIRIANELEANGFLKSISGEKDFDAIVNAVLRMTTGESNGLIIFGGCGTGKTTACKAICKTLQGWRRFSSFYGGVTNYSLQAPWLDDIESLFVDDLGMEKPINNYGNITEPIGEYIMRRDAHNQRYPEHQYLFLATTNNTSAELVDRYSERIIDRLQDTDKIKFDGASKRKPNHKKQERIF